MVEVRGCLRVAETARFAALEWRYMVGWIAEVCCNIWINGYRLRWIEICEEDSGEHLPRVSKARAV